MKKKHVFYAILLGIFLYTCKSTIYTPIDTTGRQIKPDEVIGYHNPVNMRIAWFPYRDLTIKQKNDNTWVVVKNDPEAKSGNMPVILVDYGQDSIWIDMNTDNETLGRLIKHTLMTEEPISKPFAQYFELAQCSKCHPSDIDKGF